MGDSVLMQKQQVTIRAPFQAALDTMLDHERKNIWDEKCFDYRVLYQAPDNSHRRIYYAVKSPLPSLAGNRDLKIEEHYKANFPEPGMFTYIQLSKENEQDE